MTQEEALKLLRGGKGGIAEWNRQREAGIQIPSLSGADLSDVVLSNANLSGADLYNVNLTSAYLRDAKLQFANLSGANLCDTNLQFVDLVSANLSGASLIGANLRKAILRNASLSGADISCANLSGADLSDADLSGADLRDANLSGTNLRDANLDSTDLRGADLRLAVLEACRLGETNFSNACLGWTNLLTMDLSEVHGLDSARFAGPCSIGVDTLVQSKGQIPESFLRGCGFPCWQVIQAQAYDPELTSDQFTDLQYKVINTRNKGPIALGGVFISYSSEDSGFADKIHNRLQKDDISTWLDRHDMVAGDIHKQISRAIRLNDVVLLVLSESSVNSDWVEHELEMARKKEKDEGRDVLCPVALDDSWKSKTDDVLWRQVQKKNVIDFSQWKTKAFESEYRKLVAGLMVNYGPSAT